MALPLIATIVLIFTAIGTPNVVESAGQIKRTILVNPDQKLGNFTTVKAAINAVPENNKEWICIFLSEGSFREKVIIPRTKPFIILKARSRRTTEIVWDDHNDTLQSVTFDSQAENVVVKRISFRNSFNTPMNKSRPVTQAVAALVRGDKSSFYGCGFYGLQDTLWDDKGRHYFKQCVIQGAVDFIFGMGQSIYEDCSIRSMAGLLEPNGTVGIITAQGRNATNETNGFVFKNSAVTGTGSSVLGRPWRHHARVLFYNCSLSEAVNPKGWGVGSFPGEEEKFIFAEHGCFGPGANTSTRVPWEKKLSLETIRELTDIRYIDSEGWLGLQPS